MKKIFVPLLVMLLALIFPIRAAAESVTVYNFPEDNFSVEIPDSFTVITKYVKEGDPVLEEIEGEYSEIIEYIETIGCCLRAWNTAEDIDVSTSVSEILDDLRTANEEEISMIKEVLEQGYKDSGADIEEIQEYDTASAKYLLLSIRYQEERGYVYAEQYITVVNKTTYCFTLQSYRGKPFVTQKDVIKAVVDSVKFGTDISPAGSSLAGDNSALEENTLPGLELIDDPEFQEAIENINMDSALEGIKKGAVIGGIVGLVIVAGIIVLVVVLSKNKKKQAAQAEAAAAARTEADRLEAERRIAESVKCPYCDSLNEPGSIFCAACGANMQPEEED